MEGEHGASILTESQDERLKTLAGILSPGVVLLLLLPLFFTRDRFLTLPGIFDLLVPGLGVLFVVSAFWIRLRILLTADRSKLEIRCRLLGVDLDKTEYDLSSIRHVCLNWDDQPPFLAAIVKRREIHPVSIRFEDGQKKLILQAKTVDGAKDFANLIQRLSDSAKSMASQR